MVRQAAPGGQYAGHKFDAVGPADYNPQFTLQHRNRQTDFSRSNTRREIFKSKKTPGPGQYQLRQEESPGTTASASAVAGQQKSRGSGDAQGGSLADVDPSQQQPAYQNGARVLSAEMTAEAAMREGQQPQEPAWQKAVP